ncbi:MAG TPA: hypothetical protein VJ843_02245 [Candidatus Saccharimonadales bacterium]|nr:hypothetical protein [Candidatus Saccharimonadales bacterium]
MRARHNLPQHQILRDPQAYIRYIGKHDKANTLEAFKTDGEDVILRACIAPGGDMPLRALGYYAILEHVNRVYLPKAQAQLVLTANTADHVNGRLTQGSRYETAEKLIEYIGFLPPHPDAKKRPLILFDTDDISQISTEGLAKALQGTPEEEKLAQQANRRSADHLSYLAAHLIMHDTVACVQRFDHNQPQPARYARQLISVGGAAEESFYGARYLAKRHGVHIPDQIQDTGQLFTHHDTVPCYQFARQPQEGEPLFDPPITDVLSLYDPILQDPLRVRTSSALRDVAYVRDYVDYVSAAETEFTSPKVLADYA